MERLEALTRAWYEWELRGRGWQAYPYPVELEPPYRPLRRPRPAPPDDGRIPGPLDRLLGGLRLAPERDAQEDAGEPEPAPSEPPGEIAEVLLLAPPDLAVDAEANLAWLATLRALGEPLAFEGVGAAGEVSLRFAGSAAAVDYAASSLQSIFPKVAFTPAPALAALWAEAEGRGEFLEYGLAREWMLPLAMPRRFNPDPLAPVVGALQGVPRGEVACLQLLLQPTRAPWETAALAAVLTPEGQPFFLDAPEITARAREKVSTPIAAAVLRAAAKGARPEELLVPLAGALAYLGSPLGNDLLPLAAAAGDLTGDLLGRRSRRAGMLLSLHELSALVHPPSAGLALPALRRLSATSRPLPAALEGARGVLLGWCRHEGDASEVRLPDEARSRHVHVVGASGTGKSTLLLSMLLGDARRGAGCALLDPHGDLAEEFLARLPEERLGGVVLLDPADADHTAGWNPLRADSPAEAELLAGDLLGIFRRLSTSWGDQMSAVLGNALGALLAHPHGASVADLKRFLADPAFRAEALRAVSDRYVLDFFRYEFPRLKGHPESPILTRLDALLRSPLLRRVLAPKAGGLNLRDLLDRGGILVAKLAQGLVGSENASLLGSLLVSGFHQAALARADREEAERPPFFLYLDEFHLVATPSMAAVFSGVRKFGLALTVAHQDLYQLHHALPEVERAVLANAHTRICFRVGDEDARTLARGLADFTAEDLMGLRTGEAVCRVGTRDADFILATERLPPLDPVDAARRRQAARSLSGERWGTRPSEEGEKERQAPESAEFPALAPQAAEERRPRDSRDRPPETRPRPAPRPPARLQLDKLALDYLALVASRPFLTTRERNRELGLSAWKGHQVKSALIKDGLVEEVAVNPGGRGERFKLLNLTAAGRDLLASFGVAPAVGLGRGGVAHQWWTERLASWLREQGVTVRVEDESKGARVDLAVKLRGKDVAIEIEMGDGHALENVRKDLAAGYAEVVSFLDDAVAAERLRTRLPPDLQETARSVRIAELREHEAALASLLESSPPIPAPNQKQERGGGRRRRARPAPPKAPLQPVSPALSDPGAYTTPVAAEYLGLSPATLETLRSRGGGPPFVKLGRRVVYRQVDLDRWLEERVHR